MQELREIVDIMHATSVEIFETKKQALEEGNEAVERQVAKGKDVMSILRRRIYLSGFPVGFLVTNLAFST